MTKNWLEISVNTTTIVGELLTEMLLEKGSKGVVLGHWEPDKLSEFTTLRAYFPPENYEESILTEINEKLTFYASNGLKKGSGEISVNEVKEEDWANSWKKFFHTLHVGENLVIRPIWEEYKAKKSDLVIDIDPGMAFGTGTHGTTQLCMKDIEILSKEITEKDDYQILDLGTGSGILAIAASLLGFKNIYAIDNDIVAAKVAKENIVFNKAENILVEQNEIGKIGDKKFDLIIGNILADILINLSNDISKKLKNKGIFLASGVIRSQEKQVIKEFEKHNLNYEYTKYQGEWCLIKFLKKD